MAGVDLPAQRFLNREILSSVILTLRSQNDATRLTGSFHSFGSVTMLVDLVQVETVDGVRLDGALRTPRTATASALGVDMMIMHHGVGDNFYHSSLFDDYSDALVERGCAVLRVNNRGHDLVSSAVVRQAGQRPKSRRMGAAYEDIEACRHDFEAWVELAHVAGYRRIGLWGHSLGAAKSIYYMATRKDSRVNCVVAASPPRFSFADFLTADDSDSFRSNVALAERHVQQGNPDMLLDVRFPIPLLVSARTFLQKYGSQDHFDILSHIPQLTVPTLILIGTREAQTMIAFQGLPLKIAQLADELEHLTFALIEGADHLYTQQRHEVWQVVCSWLETGGQGSGLDF